MPRKVGFIPYIYIYIYILRISHIFLTYQHVNILFCFHLSFREKTSIFIIVSGKSEPVEKVIQISNRLWKVKAESMVMKLFLSTYICKSPLVAQTNWTSNLVATMKHSIRAYHCISFPEKNNFWFWSLLEMIYRYFYFP